MGRMRRCFLAYDITGPRLGYQITIVGERLIGQCYGVASDFEMARQGSAGRKPFAGLQGPTQYRVDHLFSELALQRGGKRRIELEQYFFHVDVFGTIHTPIWFYMNNNIGFSDLAREIVLPVVMLSSAWLITVVMVPIAL